MTPPARIAAAIEILAAILGGTTPAERVLRTYFAARRYAGSGDRAAIGELVYDVLRHKASLAWRLAQAAGRPAEGCRASPRRLILSALAARHGAAARTFFDDSAYGPGALTETEHTCLDRLAALAGEPAALSVRAEIPDWLEGELRARFGDRLLDEARALNERAPADLRVNGLRSSREAVLHVLAEDGIAAAPSTYAPSGIRLAVPRPMAAHRLYRDGAIEVQDEGAQIAALLVDAAPGHQVVDYCAGAGGKSLALAAVMENRGQIYAADISNRRLAALRDRVQRAGVRNLQTVRLPRDGLGALAELRGRADRVLVDAPCSGSGTWRRHPELKWRLSPEMLDRYVARQDAILETAADLVKPGGRLVYVTCSVLPVEDEARIDAFLAHRGDFALCAARDIWAETIAEPWPGDGAAPLQGGALLLTPLRHGTDGFYVAILERRS